VPAPGGSPAVVFRNFSFRYAAQREPTLRDINLTVARGEKILILGPSGSGKSTLTYCLNGLIPHAFPGRIDGSLAILGEDAAGLSIFEMSKRVGTVLQDTDGQFVGLSAAEDIAFALENDAVEGAEMRRRVRDAARLVDMEAFLEREPRDLSGGQKQRVALAGVLIDDVEILLFDEPLANLDPAAGQEAMEIIDRIDGGGDDAATDGATAGDGAADGATTGDGVTATGGRRRKTVIIVEHRLEDALHRPVDRIVLMDRGRIVADLPPAALLATDLLRRTGVREPLYLSALRCAGVPVTAASHGDDLARLVFDAGKVRAWFASVSSIVEAPPAPAAPPASPEPPLLEFQHVSFAYPGPGGDPGPWTLRDLSFAIPRGSMVSLVGKNGAGKSTIARLVCGFVMPSTDAAGGDGTGAADGGGGGGLGRILFEGRDMAGLSIKERAERAGFVMQNPNQMFSTPLIYDEAARALRNRGVAEAEVRDRVHAALEVCGLSPYRSWPIRALSYGQKKRLAVAAIIVTDVRLLILDEPTAGLDPKQILEIRGLITELGRDHTVILSSHILPEVSAVCRRVLIINRGKIVADGAPETLAKRLLGSSHIMMRLDAGGGGEAAVSTALNRVPAIRRIEFRESQEPGTVELVAEAEGDADIRRDLFHALAGAGIPILMTRSLDLSLEEIFLNLTTTEPAGTGPAAAAGNAGKEND